MNEIIEDIIENFKVTIEENIVKSKNNDYDYDKKLKLLNELEKEVTKEIQGIKDFILKDIEFCPTCNCYYNKKFFEEEKDFETRKWTRYISYCGYDGEYKTTDVSGIATYHICPRGHKNEISFE